MKESTKALLYATVLGLVTDAILGRNVQVDELIDCLEILGMDSDYVLSIPPVQSLHHISTQFASMEITPEIIEEIKKGEAHE